MEDAGVGGQWTEVSADGDDAIDPPSEFSERAVARDTDIYEAFEAEGPAAWHRAADLLDWERPYETVLDDSDPPFYEWFPEGRLNAAVNCVDRHLDDRRNQLAIRWFGKR